MNDAALTLDRLTERAGQFYSLPAVAMQVLELTNNPRVDVLALRECIEKDPALTCKILRLVNSSLFGVSRRVSDLNQALALMGVKPLKLLVLGFSLPPGMFAGLATDVLGHYWRYALTKAMAARELSEKLWHTAGDDCFVVALLQDVGLVLLIQELGDPYLRLVSRTWASGRDLLEMERAALGFDHRQLSARLLHRWQLPDSLVEAVAADPADDRPAVQVVRLADAVARLLVERHALALTALREGVCGAQTVSDRQLAEIVKDLDQKVKGLAEILNLQLPEGLEYRDVLAQAHAQLSEVAGEAAASLVRLASEPPACEDDAGVLREIEELSAAVRRVTETMPRVPPPVDKASTRTPRTALGRGGPNTKDAAFQSSNARMLDALRQAVTACRQSRCPLSLLVAETEPADASGDGREAVQRLVHACQGVDHPWYVCVASDKGCALVLSNCERRVAIDLGNQIIEQLQTVLPGGHGVEPSPARVSVGVATVSLPPKNFPAEALLEGASRCLSGSRAFGGGAVKSIEIY